MLGGMETIIGLLIIAVFIGLFGPKAYYRWRKHIAYGKLIDFAIKKKAEKLEREIREGKIDEDKLLGKIEEELEKD